jgi:hypothetical protein
MYLGFVPRIALESLNSGEARIDKIISLIEDSKYAIHDLSRIQAEKAGEYFRLNMPFELGLDVGCQMFRSGLAREKKCLILEAKKFRYQAALSDLSNSDIEVHDNKPINVVRVVRNWLNQEAKLKHAPGPAKVWGAFNDFMAYNFDILTNRGFSKKDIEKLPISELMDCINDWLAKEQLS